MEVKSREVLDVLTELGLGEGKTHSSSIEDYEAEKVRGHFGKARAAAHAAPSARARDSIQPKIDLSHVHKPGDVAKLIAEKKKADEESARRSHVSRPGRKASRSSAGCEGHTGQAGCGRGAAHGSQTGASPRCACRPPGAADRFGSGQARGDFVSSFSNCGGQTSYRDNAGTASRGGHGAAGCGGGKATSCASGPRAGSRASSGQTGRSGTCSAGCSCTFNTRCRSCSGGRGSSRV